MTYLELKNPGIKSVVVVFVNVAVDVHAFSKLCCPKNRRCESSRVTLPLIKRHDKSTKSNYRKSSFFYFLVFVSFARSTFLRNPDVKGVVIHMITPTKQDLLCQVVGEQCFVVIPWMTVFSFLSFCKTCLLSVSS